MKKVIELIRVSTESQAASDRAGIPSQRAVNRQTAAIYSLEIIRSIEITDVSGTVVLRSPEMKELVRLMESPEIHGVVVREFSRLMRPENFSDFVLLQAFVDTETVLYLPDGPIDFASDTGRLIGLVKSWGAGSEKIEWLKRAWQAKENNRHKGGFSQCAICLPHGVAYSQESGWRYTEEAENVREAFRLFLSGQTGYTDIARQVGIKATSLRVILRNPIYTGWRVIEHRRDMSAKARRWKPDGRQKDRPKMRRAPEDVIRVKVIDQPLISQAEFERVQEMIAQKKTRHWRVRADYSRRFTYHGFLTCKCGQLIYTSYQRDDYYVCKDRRLGQKCDTQYMRRDRLESELDRLLGCRLSDRVFLKEMFRRYCERINGTGDESAKADRLRSQLKQAEAKRDRILDLYTDGLIARSERDKRLARTDEETRRIQGQLNQTPATPALDVTRLAALFIPLIGYPNLDRERKRKILTTLVPEIKVANYLIHGIYVNLPTCSNESNLTDKATLVTPVYMPLELAA